MEVMYSMVATVNNYCSAYLRDCIVVKRRNLKKFSRTFFSQEPNYLYGCYLDLLCSFTIYTNMESCAPEIMFPCQLYLN